MNDDDIKIYVPKAGGVNSAADETDEVKVYFSGSADTSAPEQSAHLP